MKKMLMMMGKTSQHEFKNIIIHVFFSVCIIIYLYFFSVRLLLLFPPLSKIHDEMMHTLSFSTTKPDLFFNTMHIIVDKRNFRHIVQSYRIVQYQPNLVPQ